MHSRLVVDILGGKFAGAVASLSVRLMAGLRANHDAPVPIWRGPRSFFTHNTKILITPREASSESYTLLTMPPHGVYGHRRQLGLRRGHQLTPVFGKSTASALHIPRAVMHLTCSDRRKRDQDNL